MKFIRRSTNKKIKFAKKPKVTVPRVTFKNDHLKYYSRTYSLKTFFKLINESLKKLKNNYLDGRDLSVLCEHVGQILFGEFFPEVLDKDVGEALGLLTQLLLAFLARDEAADVDLNKDKTVYNWK